MTQETTCKIRQMTRSELDTAVSWAAAEGWNPGKFDADVFWQTDPNGFFALEHNNQMIGSGSAVSYDGQFGFMGFFIVKPEYRGKGFGGQLWLNMRDTLKSRLDQGTAIGIDGVFAMQQSYSKTGFAFSHRNLRMEGIAEGLTNNSSDKSENENDLVTIQPPRADDLEQLIAADARWFGCRRQRFLTAWLEMKDSHSLIYNMGSQILGYGTIRPCQQGFKIGPLFATSGEIAEQLYCALSAKVIGQVIFLDVPENNSAALSLAAKHKLRETFGCARMYLGAAPALDYSQTFGVTTFELG